jgi:hypothetical protein
MVGVPRSKGCITCRKRKIGCSRERPICSQCKSTGRECLGYARQTIFLNNNQHYTVQGTNALNKADFADFVPDIQVHRPVKHREPSSYQNAVPDLALVHGSDSSDFDSRSPEDSQPFFTENSISEPNILEWSDSAEYASDTQNELPSVKDWELISGPETQLCLASSYTRRQILAPFFQMASTSHTPLSSSKPWTALIPSIVQLDQSLELAVLALATVRMGKLSGDDRLIRQSLKIYGQGLKQMQFALWNPKRMYSDQVLGACLLLTMYEVMECPSHSRVGYISHHNGSARLVELRGAKAHVTGLGHALFLQFRYMASLESLVSKQTFLDKKEWRTIPWTVEPKEVLDRFLDVFLGGVAILWEADLLQWTKDKRDLMAIGVQLINKCWDFDQELQSFYESLKTTYGKPLFWPVMTYDDSPHSDSLASTRFEFAEMNIATTMMLYWATLTVLWSGMARMYNLVDEIAEDIIPSLKRSSAASVDMTQIYKLLGLPERGRSQDFIITARKVCQSVESCMSNDMSRRTIVAPLTMICDTLIPWKKYDEEIKFIVSKLAFVEKNGMKIVPYIADLKL